MPRLLLRTNGIWHPRRSGKQYQWHQKPVPMEEEKECVKSYLVEPPKSNTRKSEGGESGAAPRKAIVFKPRARTHLDSE